MKDWHKLKPELFKKQPYYLPGCDSWQSLSLHLLALHVTLAMGLLALARTAPEAAAIASICLALATGVFGLRVVLVKIGPEGRLASRLARFYAAIGWPLPETT
jgi:PST family polysaccharide transporter